DEASVDRDAMALDLLDRPPVAVRLLRLPVRSPLDTVQHACTRALEADQELGAATATQQLQQLDVVGYRDVGLGEPSHALVRQRPDQGAAVALVRERIVIGQLDE